MDEYLKNVFHVLHTHTGPIRPGQISHIMAVVTHMQDGEIFADVYDNHRVYKGTHSTNDYY